MIVNKQPDTVVRTSGHTENMRIDATSLPHLMNLLTDLYSDPELAVIREYSTNAMDSHIAAGKPNTPIDVTLPGTSFIVQDHGLGLSAQEVFEIYGSYGASTKRLSNDFTGQLGLGSKSALTYARSFTLTTVKDGSRWVFVIAKDDQGTPSITMLSHSMTDEHNGVRVEIPVSNVYSFNRTAREFFSWWSVVPNGVEVKKPEVLWLSDKIAATTHSSGVLMGNVLYPITREGPYGGNYIFVVNVGDVDFTPSRENLQYNKRTVSLLKEYSEEAKKLTKQYIEDELAKCSTDLEKLDKGNQLRSYFWAYVNSALMEVRRDTSGKIFSNGRSDTHAYIVPDTMVFFGRPTSHQSRKLRKLSKTLGSIYVLFSRTPENFTCPADRIVTAEMLAEVKLSGTSSRQGLTTVVNGRQWATTKQDSSIVVNNPLYATRAQVAAIKSSMAGRVVPDRTVIVTRASEVEKNKGNTLYDWVDSFVTKTLTKGDDAIPAMLWNTLRELPSTLTDSTYNIGSVANGPLKELLDIYKKAGTGARPLDLAVCYDLALYGDYSHTLLTELKDKVSSLRTRIERLTKEVRMQYPMLFPRPTADEVKAYVKKMKGDK